MGPSNPVRIVDSEIALDADLQIGGADVDVANPVPVEPGTGAEFGVTFDVIGPQTMTIANGAAAPAAPVDLGRPCTLIIIRCADCTGIDADTGVTAQVGMAAADTLCDLYQRDAIGTLWADGETLPATGTWHAAILDAVGIRRLQLTLSKVTTAEVVFTVYGLDSGV